MRQINFLIIFILCLALVLFGIENTALATIQVVPGLQVQAPLSIELILAMGLGAILAWLYSIWAQLQRWMGSYQQIRQKNARIQELEQNIEQYKAEIQSLKPTLPPAKDSLTKEAQSAEAAAS